MSLFLGIDTSNYTTSVAVYNSENGEMLQRKQLLPVKQGQLGLRQSDAVFHHTQQLHTLVEDIAKEVDLSGVSALGVSTRPRPVDGIYAVLYGWRKHSKNYIGSNKKASPDIFTSGGAYCRSTVFSRKRRFV